VNAWINQNRIITADPLPKDVVILTYIDGKLAELSSIANHEKVVVLARQIAEKSGFPVKVLPVSFTEALHFLNISREDFFRGFGDEKDARAWAVKSLKTVLREENDGTVRGEAYDLLVSMGELTT